MRISKWTFYRGNEKENTTQNSSRHQQMKESISMGQIQATGNYPDAVPAKMLGGLKNGSKGKYSKYDILSSFQSVLWLYYAKKWYSYSNGITAMSAQVVSDPTAVMDTEHHHKSSMALSRSSSDKHSSVPRRR